MPSWLNSAPCNYGDAKAGIVKAGKWRNLSTIFLPIALISLWGEGTSHPLPTITVRVHHILDHTMLLVSAVSLTCMHTMIPGHSAAYLKYMTQYIHNFLHIHVDIKPCPNMHMAMHILHFLCLFGPVWSWWCFPFEQLIGQIQRLLSNHKFSILISYFVSSFKMSDLSNSGQMELTLLHSFLRAGNLKRWLAKPDCPTVIKECKLLFDKFYLPKVPEDHSGNVHGDTDNAGTMSNTIPMDLCSLLALFQHHITICVRLWHNGVMLATSKTHIRNSLVQFYPQGNQLMLIPGSIKYIYQESSRFVLVIQWQLPSDNVSGPYSIYPHFPTKLYSSSLSQELEHVEPDWIYAHYARWKVSCTQSVVLSLSHVHHLYIWCIPVSLWTLQEWTLYSSLYIFSLNSIQFVNLLVLKSIQKKKRNSELQRVRQWASVSYTNFLTA